MADYDNEAEVRARAQALRSTIEAMQAEEQMLQARLAHAQPAEAAAPEAAAAAAPPPPAAHAPLPPPPPPTPRPEPSHPHPQEERERMRDEQMRRLMETVSDLGAQIAQVREQGRGLGSPIPGRNDMSFMSSSNASQGNGSRSRASGKVPIPTPI